MRLGEKRDNPFLFDTFPGGKNDKWTVYLSKVTVLCLSSLWNPFFLGISSGDAQMGFVQAFRVDTYNFGPGCIYHVGMRNKSVYHQWQEAKVAIPTSIARLWLSGLFAFPKIAEQH